MGGRHPCTLPRCLNRHSSSVNVRNNVHVIIVNTYTHVHTLIYLYKREGRREGEKERGKGDNWGYLEDTDYIKT